MTGTNLGMRAGLLAIACGLFMGVTPAKADISLSFSNVDNTVISFSGGAFSFTSDSSQPDGFQFRLTSQSGGVGDSISPTALKGFLAPGGPFAIGTVSTTNTPFGPEETAPVTGSATLHIRDGANVDLTATIQWINITTLGTQGILDLNGDINLTGIQYTGNNSDLKALAADNPATDSITFQFTPAMTLDDLKTTGGSTSYSGTIFAVGSNGSPEPSSIGLAGISIIGMLARRRRTA